MTVQVMRVYSCVQSHPFAFITTTKQLLFHNGSEMCGRIGLRTRVTCQCQIPQVRLATIVFSTSGEYVVQFRYTVLLMPNGPVR